METDRTRARAAQRLDRRRTILILGVRHVVAAGGLAEWVLRAQSQRRVKSGAGGWEDERRRCEKRMLIVTDRGIGLSKCRVRGTRHGLHASVVSKRRAGDQKITFFR